MYKAILTFLGGGPCNYRCRANNLPMLILTKEIISSGSLSTVARSRCWGKVCKEIIPPGWNLPYPGRLHLCSQEPLSNLLTSWITLYFQHLLTSLMTEELGQKYVWSLSLTCYNYIHKRTECMKYWCDILMGLFVRLLYMTKPLEPTLNDKLKY